MAAQRAGRVLIVDNDIRTALLLKENLEEEGYDVRVAEGAGDSLVNHALELSHDFRPHAAIVDLRIGGVPALDMLRSTDHRGLELLRGLDQARCILRSAFLTPEVVRAAIKEFRAFDVIGAQESPRRLLDAVAAAMEESRASTRGFQIHWPSEWSPRQVVETLVGKEANVPPDVVEDVLGCVFAEAQSVRLETLGGAEVTPQSATRGRSVVLKAWPDSQLEPLVVKVAPTRRIVAEAHNYFDCVKGNLRGQFHAILQGTPVTFWDLGGVLYTFVGAPRQTLPSFAAFYREQQEPQAIVRPLQHFFEEVWGDLYRKATQVGQPLFPAYDKVLRLNDRLVRFPDTREKIEFPGVSVILPNPVLWVLRHKEADSIPYTRQAITHGDLHGDNLFVDRVHAWAIDFERSGPGPMLRDFVELEVDIVTRLISVPENDLSRFYEVAVILTEPAELTASLQPTPLVAQDPEITKALGVINGLRCLACETTGCLDTREYLWGLLLDALFVASLVPQGMPQRERALLLASVLCERLER